jgi:mycothiol synthase
MAMTEIGLQLADAPSIRGLRFRPFQTDADWTAIADLITIASHADGLDFAPGPDNLRSEYSREEAFDPRADIVLAELDGRLVGAGIAYRSVRDGIALYSTQGTVHPGHRRRGIGRAILRHNERRLRRIAEGHGDPGGRSFEAWIDDKEGGAPELLAQEGYKAFRYAFSMRRPNLDEVPDIGLPDGLEIRPVREEHHRAIYEADNEAFRDHWGHRDPTEADFIATFSAPDLDTSLWQVAWDGDEVAGSVLLSIWRDENERLGVRRGWLDHVSVRRPWRRRGVARALIAASLRVLKERGMDEAMLGVDSENPHGALKLYEDLGFSLRQRGTNWRKAW